MEMTILSFGCHGAHGTALSSFFFSLLSMVVAFVVFLVAMVVALMVFLVAMVVAFVVFVIAMFMALMVGVLVFLGCLCQGGIRRPDKDFFSVFSIAKPFFLIKRVSRSLCIGVPVGLAYRSASCWWQSVYSEGSSPV